MTTSESSPTVKVDWSNNKICVPEFAPEIMVSLRYILSPDFNSLVSVLTTPDIAPTTPTNCFFISSFSSAIACKFKKNTNVIRLASSFFISEK